MSYFLREIVSRDILDNSPNKVHSRPVSKISEEYAELLKSFHNVPSQAEWFHLPAHKETPPKINLATRYPSVCREVTDAQFVVGLPSSFATVAIAKYLLEKYGRLLHQDEESEEGPYLVPNVDKDVAKLDPLSHIGISSIFDILLQLSRRDPELCNQALGSLFSLLQNMPVDSLRHEPQGTVSSMINVLKQLREEGSNQVCTRASASLTALAVASGQPSHIIAAIEALITGKQKEPLSCDSNYDMIQIPENLHKFALKVQQKIYSNQETSNQNPSWSAKSLDDHRMLCAFDIPQMPLDSPTDTPDEDMRLHGSLASDGRYLYVLNYIGLYKLGTGMNETILGKLYAANSSFRATKNCMLTFCNSSLYLRRGQSSCISVLDTDSLRDIGEIMLPTAVMQSAIFSDGSYFYSTTINQQSTITLIPLNDSFVPSSESKARKKYRLTDVSYHCLGETKPIPHELPLNLPNSLHGQAVDLHLGNDIAFVQSRAGKVFYAGNGSKFGLQETGNIWMELVLPEPVVQMSVGTERMLFRSGSGHIWSAGVDDRRKSGKLKRLPTVNRRKAISISSSSATFAYVTENGRVFMGGKHNMRTHAETGQVLGLEGIHMVTVGLGKTHAVAISRHGHIYTWGLNNLNQCGRVEPLPAASPNKEQNKDQNITECVQHYFMVDVPSICNRCGNCSARGPACSSTSGKGEPCSCGTGETACLRCGNCRSCTEMTNESTSSAENVGPSRTFLEPARLVLLKGSHDVKAASVSCGNFHTLLLAADRRVFAFGSNVHGQLGAGDTKPRSDPVQVILPAEVQVVQIAAGANHSVLRTSCGAVYTFGAHKHNQLGREPSEDPRWHCIPNRVDGFGPGQGAFASWVGATGDATLIHSHKSLINNDDIIDAQIVSTKNDLFIFPRHIGMDYISLRRKQGTFSHFQLGPTGLYTSWCLEPRFDVLWSYNAAEMRIQAHTSHFASPSEQHSTDPLEDLSFLRCPEFSIPNEISTSYSSTQLGINLLSYLYAITTIYKSDFWSDKQFLTTTIDSDLSTPDGYNIVSRFEGTGGGWGYSAHSVEAIQFMTTRDIKLLGIGLYGGRGEYISKIKILRLLGMDADEMYVEHLTESDETIYECSPRETAALMLSQPVLIKADQWHVISAKISGPSSDCGAAGKAMVECEDVIFQFRNSMISNNGTDTNVGQIPELYYQVDAQSSVGKSNEQNTPDELTLSKIFTSQSLESVTPQLFSNLISILEWSLQHVFNQNGDNDEKVWEAERSSVVSLMILRLLSYFWQFVYVVNSKSEPIWDYAAAMTDLHDCLLKLFQTASNVLIDETYYHRLILSEAIRLFHSLSHVFMSTRNLVACHLADIMSGPVGDVYSAAVLGCIEKKKDIINLLLHQTQEESYPKLATHLEAKFNLDMKDVNILTSFSNVLRFLYDQSFLSSSFSYGNGKYDVAAMAQNILIHLSEQLVIPTTHIALGPTVHHTPSRFRRRSSVAAWNMCTSAPDAILFRLESQHDLMLHGVAVYISPEVESSKVAWNCEVYQMQRSECTKLVTVSNITTENAGSQDIGILRLPFPVRIKPEETCGVKVWTCESSVRTFCGEAGLSHIRLEHGGRIHFNTSSLSENGTTLQRGQIPYLLYSLKEKESVDQDMDREETHKAFFLLLRLLSNSIGASLSNGVLSSCSRTLMTRISGHIMVFMERHPEKAMEIMSILEQLMPMVSSLNGAMKASTISESFDRESEVCEAKTSQIVVESPHPYKPNSVHSVVVGFENVVDFMCVQFSSTCQTAQMDDTLWMYVAIRKDCYIPVGRYFGSRDWPKTPIMLPGNSLWFVLETQSQVEGLPVEQMYGFHCTVTGYPTPSRESGLIVEQELAWLSASACRILVQLPPDPNTVEKMLITEDDTRMLLEKHGSLLKRGLSLTHQPTLNEVITKGIPQPAQTPDILFLREFVTASPATTSGLLAHWLPAGPVVDPTKCQLSITQTEMIVGKTVPIRVCIKDQFDRPVLCPHLEIEVILQTGSKSVNMKSLNGQNNNSELTLEMLMKNPFQPVLTHRSRFMSICAMPVFSNYSNEEIRLALDKEVSVKDSLKLRHWKNSTFTGEWVPTAAGTYKVECKIDGFELSHTYTIHVLQRDNNDQETRLRKEHRVAQLSRAQLIILPALSDFRGVRMRSAASLTAPCLGTIPRGASLSFIEVVENDDGKWLRLTDETAALYGSLSDEHVWCLAYSNHLRRELIPTGEDGNKDVDRAPIRRQTDHPMPPNISSQRSVVIDTNEIYILESGESLPVYARPSPDALIDGNRLEGRREISSDGWVSNHYGVWIKMSGTQRFVLIESALGKSSIHSQSFSTNGNDDEEPSPIKRTSIGIVALPALRPLVADCTRAVFAAFLWHEHLVKDAMAAATYLKFHQHLHNMWSSTEQQTAAVPPALQPIVRLWNEVCQAVQASIDQHLIMPPASATISGKRNKKRDNSAGNCELCEDAFKVPIAVHMRMSHPGCGSDSQGYGYNSKGRLTTGWSGECGSGGRTGSAWYLMCPTCRNRYLKKTPAGFRQERTKRWREFRLSATSFESRPEVIIKQNALFLLDLNSSIDCDSKTSSTSSGWAVNLFPTQTPSPVSRSGVRSKLDTSQLARSSFMAHSVMKMGHSSDPGPKGPLMSPPTQQAPTSSLGQCRVHQSINENNQEVLQSPSAALRTLLSGNAPTTTSILKRPVMSFVLEHHDLKKIREACELSIRRAVSFSHAFRVWNWLLRLVSSETSVSDIIFQYLSALSSYHRLSLGSQSSDHQILPHPWRLCFLAGPLAVKVVHHLHAFLYTIAVILQSTGVDAKLRSLCFKAWTIQLTIHEQELLILTCNILATVGGVLSDGSTSDNWISNSSRVFQQPDSVDVKEMKDLTLSVQIEASSRQAMVVCLQDGNPDTFWESGDEDKSRRRWLSVKCDGENITPVLMCVYIDNAKDEAYRTDEIIFRGTLTSDGSRKELLHRNLELNFANWITCCIAGTSHIQISLKGSSNSLRVRQLSVLGFSSRNSYDVIKPSTSHQLFFSNTQLDAFTLFQAISAQAFGSELSENQQGTLRERVVDLLCSRVQLQPLQNYVGTQVVNALEREVDLLCSLTKRNYSYACGLLDMLERICASRKGGELFAARNTILIAISQLIIFAPQVVQCQSIHVLEKLLSFFSPETVDVARFLKNILIVVSKVIILQVRDKASHTVNTAVMNESLINPPTAWRVDRVISPEIGRLMTQLMGKLTSGSFSPEWTQCIRHELASALLNVVQLTTSLCTSASKDSISRDSVSSFLGSKRFWLSVAALALVKDKGWLKTAEHWGSLQAQKEEKPETMCENHDDGQTIAQVYCTVCETALCRECFTVMHLHKKNRNHQVQALSQPAQGADIDIHQGCARLRLQQLLVLFHGDSLNGLVEISHELFPNTSTFPVLYRSTAALNQIHSCRFCGNLLDGQKQMFGGVCDHQDCVALAPSACEVLLPCGHFCSGIAGETTCMPCLNCNNDANQQDGDDVCVICFTDRLGAAPTIKLDCGHLFHFNCLKTILEKRWNGPRIHFRFINCPLCNQQISHTGLNDLLEPILKLKEDVVHKAKMRLGYDGLKECAAVTDDKSEFYNKPEEYAMERYMYVLCSQCKKAYFGGESRCQLALNSSQYNPDDLMCGGCSDTTGTQVCGRHGVEYLEYKCRYCCSIAVYFCFGTTHFCAACHDDFQRLMCLPKIQLPRCPAGPRGIELEEGPCPLKIDHPATGEEFAMGCGICRNINTF